MPKVGPVILAVVGDRFLLPCRIGSILWEGSSNAGDTVRITDPVLGIQFWKGRANDVQTYLGATFALPGLHAPNGFKLDQLSSGAVSVYLNEN